MNLRDIINNDINNLFFGLNDFCEKHILDGKEISIIVDGYKLAELKAKSQYSEEICTAEKLIYVRISDIGFIPTKGNIIEFDNEIYRVAQVTKIESVLEIILVANV